MDVLPDNPTADHVALAIVAACRETGEDPVHCASYPSHALRARHYAHHALVHCFPAINVTSVARMVGAPQPNIFHKCSISNHVRRKASTWWDEAVYARVIAAIGVEPRVTPKLPPPATPRPLAIAAPLPTKTRQERVAEFGRTIVPVAIGDVSKRAGKGALYEMLAAAVANTPGAKLASSDS